MASIPVIQSACVLFALTASMQDSQPDSSCDQEVARLATHGASGYRRREPDKGDPCCEGFFVKKVSMRSADVQLEPVECILTTRSLRAGQDLVELAWELGPGVPRLRGVALALAEGTNHPGYRMDAAEDTPGQPDAVAPEREYFNWSVKLLVEHEMSLRDVGLLLWSDELTAPVPRRLLHPLVVNGPKDTDEASTSEDVEARIHLKLRATESLRSNDLEGFWVLEGPEGEELDRRPAEFLNKPSKKLVTTTVELPPDGRVWTLYSTVVFKKGEETISLPQDPIYVAVPSAAFVRWSQGGGGR